MLKNTKSQKSLYMGYGKVENKFLRYLPLKMQKSSIEFQAEAKKMNDFICKIYRRRLLRNASLAVMLLFVGLNGISQGKHNQNTYHKDDNEIANVMLQKKLDESFDLAEQKFLSTYHVTDYKIKFIDKVDYNFSHLYFFKKAVFYELMLKYYSSENSKASSSPVKKSIIEKASEEGANRKKIVRGLDVFYDYSKILTEKTMLLQDQEFDLFLLEMEMDRMFKMRLFANLLNPKETSTETLIYKISFNVCKQSTNYCATLHFWVKVKYDGEEIYSIFPII